MRSARCGRLTPGSDVHSLTRVCAESYTIDMAHGRKIPPYGVLLVGLLGLFIVTPLLPMHRVSFLAELVFDAVLLAGVYAVGPSRHRWPFVALTVLTLAVRWGHQLGPGPFDAGALAVTAVWMLYAIVIVVTHLFGRSEANLNTIFGAIVAYLLAAALFALVFQVVAMADPDAFSGVPRAVETSKRTSTAFTYFSLVSLTTMGYGDIVPVSDLARTLSSLEGVFGQMYLAIMIARLVGLSITGNQRLSYVEDSDDAPA